ncbi:Transmembrane and coiled-coil domain-containing protein 4 [Coemansia sp. RSA 552]|nr:Transmembrane and coiled-coil domain-containing protein 4 [Coemansia sp. RSA 552]
MESLEVKDSVARHWLAALCICSGRCVMATSGARISQGWNDQFTQSVLDWLEVSSDDQADLRALPYGDSANDMVLLTLRCKRKDEESEKPSRNLVIAEGPEKLYSGLTLACLGLSERQLAELTKDQHDSSKGFAAGDGRMLRPFEYDARSRAAAFVISEWLDMPRQFVGTYEARVASALEQAAEAGALGDAGAKALEDDKRHGWGWRKYLATGAGVAVAGTLVGVTAGLAAPLLAAGLGTVGLGGLGFLATTGGAAMVGSLFGVAGGGLIGQRFSTRMRGLREFYFTQLPLATSSSSSSSSTTSKHSLHASIFVPGFIDAAAAASPFIALREVVGLDIGDAFTLYFETKELAALQSAFSDFVNGSAKSAAMSLVLRQTILSGVVGALTWPLAILKLGQLIDTPWAVGLERAKRAGRLLADVLTSRAHGKRPVTLVGYSLGALAIFTCLRELHKRKAFGIVETAVLLGMPANSEDKSAWSACCECVSRSVVVGYSESDWVLAFLFRANTFCTSLAGLTGVDAAAIFKDQPLMCRKLSCINLAGIVGQHADYLDKLDEIMLEVTRII